MLVSTKFTAGMVGTLGTVAVTLYGPPGTPFAVKVGAVAKPFTSVGTAVLPVNVPVGMLTPVGAVNCTTAPGIATSLSSVTFTLSAAAAVPTTRAVCGVPEPT